MYRIFIVEDDAAIAQAVCEQAESWALEARCVSDFRRVAEEAAAYGPHLILLDISLPFFDGYHWCRQIRRTSRVPIIFLSSADLAAEALHRRGVEGDPVGEGPLELGGHDRHVVLLSIDVAEGQTDKLDVLLLHELHYFFRRVLHVLTCFPQFKTYI